MPATDVVDLPTAAAQFFNPAMWITLGVALLVSIAALIVMRRYLAAAFRESRRRASPQGSPGIEDGTRTPLLSAIGPLEIHIETPVPPEDTHPAQSRTFQHAASAFRRAAGSYAAGGSAHAAASVALLFGFGIYAVPSIESTATRVACYAAAFWSWSFFTLIALVLFRGPDRRVRGVLIAGYAAVLPAMGALLLVAGAPRLPLADIGMMSKDEVALLIAFASAVTGQQLSAASVTISPLLQPTLFWGLSGAPFTVPVLAFNRFVRATVGPLFINVAVTMVLSTLAIIDLILSVPPGIWLVGQGKRIFGDSTYAALVVVSLTISAFAAWFGLRWIANRYRLKQLSDQTFLFDALWLLPSFWVSVYLLGARTRFAFLLGLLPFGLYKITVGIGLKRIAARLENLPKARLLFLRVFGSSSRSETLFDLLAAHWRYAGSIQLISGTDLARSRFEPDEFLDFLNSRLANAYISSGADLDRRLAGLDLRPDPDGRCRVNECFCRVDTWQPTVVSLMAASDMVVMDLRAFTSHRKGSLFELGALIDSVPLDRVILLVDRTTDEPFLKAALADLWRTLNPRSPNASGRTACVRMINLACGNRVAVHRLMRHGDEAMEEYSTSLERV